MAFNFTSYGDYFRSSQNPVCRIYGPTGPPGSGATGATGPVGPAGNNGISTGLIYYFHAQGPSGQAARGATGFVMNTNIRPGPVGGNPDYLPTVYNGYFSNISPPAGTSGPALLGEFLTSTGDPGVTLIPAGTWTFLMNIYTGIDYTGVGNTGITGTANTSISVYGEVWKISQGISTKIGNNQARPVIVNSATDDQLYTMGINIESPGQTLFTPLVDSMFVRIYAVPTTSTFVANQRIEFWTDGDSVSQVTTTLPAKSGNSGPTGPVGPSGPQGLPGKDGENGSQGIQGPMGESTWTPVTVPPTNVRIGPASGTFTKINGRVVGYDTAIRSAQSYPACYVSFNPPVNYPVGIVGGGVTGTEATFGISSIPNPLGNTGVAVTDIQYGINYNASGTTFGWYESGTSVTVPGGCAPGDSFSIIYDGTTVRYYRQNTLVRSVARAAGQTGAFHLEGNFLNYGTINNLVFGPAGQSSASYLSNYSIFTNFANTQFNDNNVIGLFTGSYTTNGSAVVQLQSSPSIINIDDTSQGFVPTVTGTFLIKIFWTILGLGPYAFSRPIFFSNAADVSTNLVANDKTLFRISNTTGNVFYVGKVNLIAGTRYVFWFPTTNAGETYRLFGGSSVEFYLVNS